MSAGRLRGSCLEIQHGLRRAVGGKVPASAVIGREEGSLKDATISGVTDLWCLAVAGGKGENQCDITVGRIKGDQRTVGIRR